MKSFKTYIIEFTEDEDYLGNTLFAIGHDGKLRLKDSPPGQVREHPDSFPDLNFGGPTSWEKDMGMTDEHKNRPKPIAHGRIDHKKRRIQIITQFGGPMPYGDPEIRPMTGIKKSKEDIQEDGFNRLEAMKLLKKSVGDHFGIYVGIRGGRLVVDSVKEHEQRVTGHMKD